MKRYLAPLLVITYLTIFSQPVEVTTKGHSHNDYTRKNPLQDALTHGFMSIEADVFYVDGQFMVAHTRAGIRKKNTLRSLYLEPLLNHTQKNNGKIYPNQTSEFILMIDLKGSWTKQNIDELNNHIIEFKDILTIFVDSIKQPSPIRILLSGSGVGFKKEVSNANPRYFSIDGRLNDLGSSYGSEIIPRISSNFKSVFSWKGKRMIPTAEKQKLAELISKAHAESRKIRFWATPHREKLWKELLDAGVDWINVDNLGKFRKFYEEYLKDQKASDN